MNLTCNLESRGWLARHFWRAVLLILLIAAGGSDAARAQPAPNQRRRASIPEAPADPAAVMASARDVLLGRPRMPHERKAVIVALGRLGAAAREAIPMLEQQLTSRDADVACEASTKS